MSEFLDMEGIIIKSSNLELGVLFINPIWHGGPQNVFDHYAQTLRRKKLKLGDFYS